MSLMLKPIILGSSIALFLFSLTQTAYYVDRSEGEMSALASLSLGWFAVAGGGAGIAWVANPLFFLSWHFFSKRIKNACILGGIATLISASFLLFHSVIADEAGNYETILKVGIGYWLWLTSILTFTIGAFICYFRDAKSIKSF